MLIKIIVQNMVLVHHESIDLLNKKFNEIIISHFGPISWSLRSCDIIRKPVIAMLSLRSANDQF